MTVSVFVGTSLDGFIARRNGDFDFLPTGGGEPHGYKEFIASVDALVIGRKTFEKVLTLEAWPYADKRVVVLSSRPVDMTAVRGGVVEQMAGPPAEIVSRLAASGAHHLYVDGGVTIQRFLQAGLIQRLIITRVHRAHWLRNSCRRRPTARHSTPSRRDPILTERLGRRCKAVLKPLF
jgi:dihydrofolate reductase